MEILQLNWTYWFHFFLVYKQFSYRTCICTSQAWHRCKNLGCLFLGGGGAEFWNSVFGGSQRNLGKRFLTRFHLFWEITVWLKKQRITIMLLINIKRLSLRVGDNLLSAYNNLRLKNQNWVVGVSILFCIIDIFGPCNGRDSFFF